MVSELQSKQQELSDINNEITKISGSVEDIKRLKMQIVNLGLEILNLTHQKDVCPLCGTKHLDKDKLLDEINRVSDIKTEGEKILAEHEKKRTKLLTEINTINQTITAINIKQSNLKLIREMAADINNSRYYFIDINIDDFSLLRELLYIDSFLIDLTDQYNHVITKIKAYEVQGYSNDIISAANLFFSNDKTYQNYLLEKKEELFEQNIAYQRQKDLSEAEIIRTKLESLNNRFDENKNKIVLLDVEMLEKKITEQRRKLNILIQLKNDIDNLISYFNLSVKDNIVDWLMNLDESFLKLDIIMSQLRLAKGLDEKHKTLSKLNEDLIVIENQINRGKDAKSKLEELKSLNEYSIQFLENNIERIEYFFKALHTPREFSSLGVNSDGIYTIREKDGRRIRMHQMSTGQRVALALAIMFSLHIAAPRAPKFILLDEPVANLDDLHLLNLIDILREFALRNTQIIFTTANPEVAGIFRRKFSFFESDFRHYELVRKNDDTTQIITLEYKPDSEEPTILDNVS